MGFPREEYWSGLPFPSPRNLPDPGIEPMSPALVGGFFTAMSPGVGLVKLNLLCFPLYISDKFRKDDVVVRDAIFNYLCLRRCALLFYVITIKHIYFS